MQGIIEGSRMLGSAGESFVNSFQKGLQMSMAVEKNKRQKQIESFEWAKNAKDTYSNMASDYGVEAADTWLSNTKKSEQWNYYIGNKDIDLTTGGYTITKYGDEAVEQSLNLKGIQVTNENVEKEKSSLKSYGYDPSKGIVFNLTGEGFGKMNEGKTLELYKEKKDITKDDKPFNINPLVTAWSKNRDEMTDSSFYGTSLLSTQEEIDAFRNFIKTVYPNTTIPTDFNREIEQYTTAQNQTQTTLSFNQDGTLKGN